MDRLNAFEEMLQDIQDRMEYEACEMERMKAEGKVQCATYKQYFSNKFVYQQIMSLYEQHGLL